MPTEEYSKTIEQLAAGLAHEVKNPLSLVRANIDLLELNDNEQRHSRNYKIMRRELERINEMMMDFIHLTEPVENNIQPFSLNTTLAGLVEQLNESYGGSIIFEQSYVGNGEDFMLNGNEGAIRRAYLNILKNAIESINAKNLKRSEDDPNIFAGRITLEAHATRDVIETCITDNGVGIKAADLDRLAQPFYSTKSGGSGLGLSIVRRTVEEHGGEFSISGQEDVGCKISIKFNRRHLD